VSGVRGGYNPLVDLVLGLGLVDHERSGYQLMRDAGGVVRVAQSIGQLDGERHLNKVIVKVGLLNI
jgi:hypothetical protein